MQHVPSATSEAPYERHAARGAADLLTAHLDAAYNLACWVMRNQADAEDMVQEAYLRAINHLPGFRGGDGRAWLLTIVRNCCYDRLRQRDYSQRNTNFDEALHGASQLTPNPEATLLLAERIKLVRKSLEELPVQYREVLVLRELEHLTYQEIAEVVRIPLGTVMSRLSRARQQFERIVLDTWNQENMTCSFAQT